MVISELKSLVERLASNRECEWIEFKHNFHSPEEIGERISALSNSACLSGQPFGYIVFGIEDQTRQIVGTTFKAKSHKVGNQELESWLSLMLNPKIDFESFEFDYSPQVHISLYKIPATTDRPVEFKNTAYVRVNSITQPLSKYPAKAAKIWKNSDRKPLEQIIVKSGLSTSDVMTLLSSETYFIRLRLPYPSTSLNVLDKFKSEKFITENENGYNITELGAILLAKNLEDFDLLGRKSVRVNIYRGKSKVETIREQFFSQGYAIAFDTMIEWIKGQLPSRQIVDSGIREDVTVYPEITIRELCANMLIHQNFSLRGFPMVDIYEDRVEISNAGLPLISADRFIDEYESRNETLSDIMRRMGICEEKGSGMDKAVYGNEKHRLPPLKIILQENRTVVTVFAPRKFSEMSKQEKLQACYQHACLKYVSGETMSNQSLRERLGIDPKNYPMVSRLIRDAQSANLIKDSDPDSGSKRNASYIPYWA